MAAIAFGAFLTACAKVSSSEAHDENQPKTTTGDREEIQAAIDRLSREGGSGVIEFDKNRTYHLGQIEAGDCMFLLRDLDKAELRGNGAVLACETVGVGKTQMFLVQRCRNLTFSNLGGEDSGAELQQQWKGMDFIHLETTAGEIENVTLADIRVDGAVSLMSVTGLGDEPRTRNIRLKRLEARNCYYGLCFQENGDGVSGDLRAINCRRAYFPYGVSGHNIELDISHDALSPGADACILIKRYRRDTRGINVSARFEGVLDWWNLVKLEQQPGEGETGTIEDIAINLSLEPGVQDPWNAARLGISAYRGGKQVPQSDDIWRGIVLEGCYGPTASAVVYHTRPSRTVDIAVRSNVRGCA